MADFFLLNGKQYAWQSVSVKFNGTPLPGLAGMDYDDSLKAGKIRGPNPDFHGWTTGQYEANATLKVLRLQHEALILAAGGVGFGENPGAILVSYFEPDLGKVLVDTIFGRIGGNKTTNSDSVDANMVEVPFEVLKPILWNGKPIIRPRL